MAKRFTDTDKWKKPFIRALQTPYKILWLYILDECDHAGIWQVDMDVARLKTGEPSISEQGAIDAFGERIIVNNDKWFINDFVEFQYGTLNPENRVHKSVIDNIDKFQNKPLKSPLKGAKDKDKDKDKDMVKDKWEQYLEKIRFDLTPFNMQSCVLVWLKYKSERKEPYTHTGFVKMVTKLLTLSGSDEVKAEAILDDAMSNNYAGFFKLKDDNTAQPQSKTDNLKETYNNVLAKLNSQPNE